ncbi:MAG: hypothetical protein JRG85_14570 [Deltaproteobacteria bacterium]|nr:hypothetical protein [Deltaproteobacteria bacterium]
MIKKRLSRIALAAILAFGVLSIGTTQSSAIEVMNGFKGTYRVIKSFALVSFEYGVWHKRRNQQAIEHKCDTKTNLGYCLFHVARTLFFDNCTLGAADEAEPGMCAVGAAMPQGAPLPEGFGDTYACSKGSIVKTIGNLLFIPDTCDNEED